MRNILKKNMKDLTKKRRKSRKQLPERPKKRRLSKKRFDYVSKRKLKDRQKSMKESKSD